jgi:hypothetical protein
MAFNDIAIGRRFDRNGLLDESIEQFSPAAGLAAIKPEGILVQVMIELLPGCPPLVDAQQPTFKQRGNTVEAWKGVGSDLALMNIPMRLEDADIGWKTVGDDGRARGHRLFHELYQAISGGEGYLLEADPPCTILAPFDGYEHYGLVSDGPASGSALASSPNHGFVHFDFAGQRLAIGADHGPTQLVQAGPSRTITPYSQGSLHSQRADTRLLVGEPPHRSKPKAQGKVAVMKNCPGGRRSHGSTILALPELPLQLPTAVQSASWTPKSIRPPDADQIEPAVLFRSELPFKLQKIPRIESPHETSI